ncbi:MAG TPA: tRNA lysidine(34) synthetase TilS [Opitutaceae bacterium]|nr:tRNA lysidine(34) synthetase TilS [Opitutaceae bacterium]
MTKKRPARARGAAAQAARVGHALPLASLHPAVVAWTARRPRREPWAVALSGGADSVALLLALRAHFPAHRLVALHFNHRLRGRAAAADARFSRRLCRALGIACAVGEWRRADARRREPARVSEAAARAARHAFFASAMKRRRLKVLWLGHQQDDVAETLLMRLARGSGTAGLAAPRPIQRQPGGRTLVRPLLTLRKGEIAAALRRARVAWREDATNAGDDFLRNRMRRSVVPAWARAVRDRDARAGAALSRELLEEDDVALEAWVDELAAIDRRGRLDLAALAGKPRAILRRALHRWLTIARPGMNLSRLGFAQLLGRIESGRPSRFSLGANGFAVIGGGRLSFRRA